MIKSQAGVNQRKVNYFLSGFRGLSFTVAIVQVMTLSRPNMVPSQTILLLVVVGTYSVIKILVPFKWYSRDYLTYLVLVGDVLACGALPFFSGAVSSGFLLYSLNGILTVALVGSRKQAIISAGVVTSFVSVGQIFATQMHLPVASLLASPAEYLGILMIYVILCFVAAVLPFLINTKIRIGIQEQAIMNERNRLAREMHDSFAQDMAYLKMKAAMLKGIVPSGTAQHELTDMRNVLDNMYAELRESLGLLRINTANGTGLAPAIVECANGFCQRTGIKTEVFITDCQTGLSNLAELHVLRIIQEALNNARKHAAASQVEVSLQLYRGWTELTVRDNGVGFDFAKNSASESGAHMGLKVMRERVEEIGGDLTISSQPGQGTKLCVRIPARRLGGKSDRVNKAVAGR